MKLIKSIATVSLLTLVSTCLHAQETTQTLFSKPDKERSISGIIGTEVNLARMNNEMWLTGGLHAGAIFNNQFAVGAFFSTSLTDIPSADYNGRSTHTDTRLGGLFAEYRFMANKLIHFTTPVAIGIGEVQRDFANDDTYDTYFGESNFWMIEPGLMAEINLTYNFLLQAGATYRAVVMERDYFELTNGNMSGITGKITLRVNLFNN